MAGQQPAWDAILSAARDDDADTVRALVSMGCPPSFGNRMGQTALHIGAIWGSSNAIKALLEAKANPNAQNQLRGSTPLHAGAMGRGPADKRAEAVKLLIAGKADPRMRDLAGETPIDAASDDVVRTALGAPPLLLHKAAGGKSLASLTDALKQVQGGLVAIDLETCDSRGETALHVAVARRWVEGVRQLLDARAAPTAQNNFNVAPLHLAAMSGDHQILRVLITARADTNAADMDADRDPRFSSKEFKEDSLDHRTPLHYAAEKGNLLAVRLLLEARADPNPQDGQRCTPLHLCLSKRNSDIDLEAGCGVRVTGLQSKADWNGKLASVVGETNGERWPVLLEDATEPALLKDANLWLVVPEALQALLDAGADVNLGNRIFGESRTMLHEAAMQGDVPLATAVVAARADVDKQDVKVGMTALHLAARGKHGGMVKLLLEAKADASVKTAAGKTAAELAEKNGAAADVLALLRGEAEVPEAPAPEEPSRPQTLENLTPEQRAMLFID